MPEKFKKNERYRGCVVDRLRSIRFSRDEVEVWCRVGNNNEDDMYEPGRAQLQKL
jgi:hypothetical protein